MARMTVNEKFLWLREHKTKEWTEAYNEVKNNLSPEFKEGNLYHISYIIELRVTRKLKWLLPIQQKKVKTSITKIAKKADNNSRACGKCPFQYRLSYNIKGVTVCDICRKAFIEGFIKGVKHIKNEIKKQHAEIDERNKVNIYKYTVNGKEQEVGCNYWTYLFLKLTYGDNGLTDEEYKVYKEHNKI